ncbi:probable carboxylesterase 12 [Setaria italica]|uniref:probable carboxylesterase 12 n=1 Tax=Setaria italica TaxID=4555 RepID=UPI000351318A|nr:probable carboxylesterase 12 [Setaria italica]
MCITSFFTISNTIWPGSELCIPQPEETLDNQLVSYHCSPRATTPPILAMDPSSEIIVDTPFFRLYSDRRIDRLMGTSTVPPGLDASTGVTSKDVVIDGDTGLYVRLYLPDTASRSDDSKKLPVLVYFHGGGFVTQSAASPAYQPFLNSLAARAGLLVVSVNYRLAPEHPLPAGYEDSFRTLKWAVSGNGDPWLSQHADHGRLFLAGDSAGGNIVHNVLMMAASEGEAGTGTAAAEARVEGAVLLHAGFGGREPVDGETPEAMEMVGKMWGFVCPEGTDGADDPRLNPLTATAPSLRNFPCKRVLVCVAEKDFTRPRGRAYYEALAASGWSGTAELFESEGQEHVFFLFKPGCDEAAALMERLVSFFAGN